MTVTSGLIMAAGLEHHAYEHVPNGTEVLILRTKTEPLPYWPLNNHPDIFAMTCGRQTILSNALDLAQMKESAQNLEVKWPTMLAHQQLIMGQETLGTAYPQTCLYNAITFNRFLIGRAASLDPQVIMTAKKSNFEILDVNQGYSRCNCFTVGDHVLVTSDLGIAKVVSKKNQVLGLDCKVLYCDPKAIQLNSFSHGFVGGATWELDQGTRYFYGDVRQLTIWPELKAVLHQFDVKPVYIKDKPLEDVGSAIAIHY